ncbi:hypothetical protein BGX38DRAFT_1181534 [Terfezia claveryi]|nr:hypothetical protein BGX38DRAFT_1181534 [Terfezia claveryi]
MGVDHCVEHYVDSLLTLVWLLLPIGLPLEKKPNRFLGYTFNMTIALHQTYFVFSLSISGTTFVCTCFCRHCF